jgi:hypothetical protein
MVLSFRSDKGGTLFVIFLEREQVGFLENDKITFLYPAVSDPDMSS